MAVALLWVYYQAQILLIGAHLAKARGGGPRAAYYQAPVALSNLLLR